MTGAATAEHRPAETPDHPHVRAGARGGALNLVGSIVYGATSFVFLAVVTNALGAVRAGPVIVAIAIFTVVGRFAELGASTGLVRLISRDRTIGAPERIAPTILAAVVPVLGAGVLGAVVLTAAADGLAALFSGGGPTAAIAQLVRVLAPFLPVVAVYTVLVQGSRGFGTMQPLVWIDKIGRGCALPVVALVVLTSGGGATAVVVSWAVVTTIAAAVTALVVHHLTRLHTRGRHGPVHLDRREIVQSFWSFSLPRAAGQSFDVAVLWLDTLLVAALIGPTAAGIYAAGTRFLLIGTFTAEAIQQAVAPKVSSLLTLGHRREAHAVVRQATTWQAAITWPVYLGVIAFSGALLGIFGPGYDRATVALTLLSIGLLLAVLGGPSDAVILMSGRSRQSLANSTVAFAVNLGGNLVLVPRWGIAAAGGVWAATLVVAAGLPALQARRSLGLTPWSAALGRTVGLAVATVGTACVVARVLLGDSLTGLALAVALGGIPYLLVMYRLRTSIHLDGLIAGLRARTRTPSEPPRLTWTPS